MLIVAIEKSGGRVEIVNSLVDLIGTFSSDLIKANAGIIQKGIATGNANAGEGMLFAMVYFDLLHGGAYRWDYQPNKLPYYTPAVQSQLVFTSPVAGAIFAFLGVATAVTLPQGYPGAGVTIGLPAGASTLQAEVLTNGFVPHILPKLLSDAAYIQVMERAGQLLNITEFNTLGTGVKTYVEAATEALGAIREAPGAQASREAEIQKAILGSALDVDTTVG